MRIFLIAADVVMGLVLGVFLYVAAAKTWSALQHPLIGAAIVVFAVVLVLFRRPNGSLARESSGSSPK